MHKLYELKEKLIKELEGYAENGKYSKEDVEAIKYMASAVDHLCNIIDDVDGMEYSGMTYSDGSMPGYGRSYARGRRGNVRRDAMGRYSRSGDVVSQLESIMENAPDERTKHEMRKFIDKMESIM